MPIIEVLLNLSQYECSINFNCFFTKGFRFLFVFVLLKNYEVKIFFACGSLCIHATSFHHQRNEAKEQDMIIFI